MMISFLYHIVPILIPISIKLQLLCMLFASLLDVAALEGTINDRNENQGKHGGKGQAADDADTEGTP